MSVSATTSDVYLDDEPIVITLHHDNREATIVRLSLYLSITRRPDTSREIYLRVTNANDPFFLYTMRLGEDEYPRFKEQQFLNVDFSTFPLFVVSLVKCNVASSSGGNNNDSIGSQLTPRRRTIEMNTELSRGVLKFIESNEFRNLENLSLHLQHESDLGQKKYLSERLKVALSAIDALQCQLRETEEKSLQESNALTGEISTLRSELHTATTRHTTEVQEVLYQTKTEVAVMNTSFSQEKQRWVEDKAALLRQHDKEVELYRTTQQQLESTVKELQQAVQAAALRENGLQSDVRLLKETETTLRKEVRHFKESFEVASNKSLELEHAVIELRQQNAMLVQSVKNKDEHIAQRDVTLKDLQKDREQQCLVLDSATKHSKDLEARKGELEAELAKCQKILGKVKDAADREVEKRGEAERRSQLLESTLNERNMSLERQKGEIATLEERVKRANVERDNVADTLKETHTKLSEVTGRLAEQEQLVLYQQHQMNKVGLSGGGGLRSTATTLNNNNPASMTSMIRPTTTLLDNSTALYNAFGRTEWRPHSSSQLQPQPQPHQQQQPAATPPPYVPSVIHNTSLPQPQNMSSASLSSSTGIQHRSGSGSGSVGGRAHDSMSGNNSYDAIPSAYFPSKVLA